MPLFRENPVRTVATAAVVLSAGHFIINMLPHSMHSFQLTQTSVAILAISSLMVMVALHHRRDGRMLTQTQEEMILIGAMGLFWMACLVAFRAYNNRGISPGRAGETDVKTVTASRAAGRQRIEPGFTLGHRPYPCSYDDVYCVVEEYSFF